jgi:hypothetical protein
VFAQIVQLAAFQVGAAIAYDGGDTKQIISELMDVHPDTSLRYRASSRSSTRWR